MRILEDSFFMKRLIKEEQEYADLVKDSAEKILYLGKRDKTLTKALIEHEKKVHEKEMEILQSIPGVGEVTKTKIIIS